MTLADRNLFFKAGIVFCAVCTVVVLIATSPVMPVYAELGENPNRSTELFEGIIINFINVNYYAVHASIAIAVLFSFISTFVIYKYFEQTNAPEILYIAIFSISISFEVFRLIVPLHSIINIPSLYMLIASRIMLFGRYFGIFSIFLAGICAAGFEVDKVHNLILIITVPVLIISIGIPIDSQTWDTSFNMITGLTSMFRLLDIVIFLITVMSFFVAAHIHSSKDYSYIGLGVFLSLIGRNLLLDADNWLSLPIGIVLLTIGMWFTCSKLHKIYLWL
jgi:hypothetical protein